MSQYTYTISTETANGAVDIPTLTTEITDSSIVTTLSYICTYSDTVAIDFVSDLSGADETTLTGVVAAHQGVAQDVSVTSDPSATDDFQNGHRIGYFWTNTSTCKTYVCVDSTNGAACWTEITEISRLTLTAGETVGAFKAIYLNADGKAYLAKADSASTMPCIGITSASANADESVVVFTNDVLDGFTSLTVGSSYYVSQATTGELTTTKPTSGIISSIGVALTTTKIDIHILDLTTQSHALAGSDHSADSLANLNSKISDANLGDTSSLNVIITGSGSVISTGIVEGDFRFPWAGTIQEVSLFSDTAGSIVLDLWVDSYANFPPTVADTICAAAKPTLSSAIKSFDSTLTGWTVSFSQGDALRINVDSVTDCTCVTLHIILKRS